jgi:hypothetical protein
VKLHELKEKLNDLELKQYDGMHLRGGTILDAEKFVQNHISFLEANAGNITYICYYERLMEFYNKTQNNGL